MMSCEFIWVRSNGKDLTPGVIFINVLQAAFTHADPKSAKDSLFALFGPTRVKAARKMLMKLTPGTTDFECSAAVNKLINKALFTRDILTDNIAIKRYFWGIDIYRPR